VHAYLRDFLFSNERARSPVKALSGGERNRLLLARLFTRPANVLVLDEPTNDLDLETLELLEEQLVEWPGTLLLVSHDRAFLDNVVTSTFAFEGEGRVREFVGGYADWLRQTASPTRTQRGAEITKGKATAAGSAATEGQSASSVASASFVSSTPAPAEKPRRLSYKEQRELEALPPRIEALEDEQRTLEATIAAPQFYREPADAINATLARLDALQQELVDAYARWEALDSRR